MAHREIDDRRPHPASRPVSDDRWMTRSDAAARLGSDVSAIRYLALAGLLEAEPGGSRVSVASVEAWRVSRPPLPRGPRLASDDEHLTRADTAARLGLSPTMVTKLARSGRLERAPDGRRFTAASVERYRDRADERAARRRNLPPPSDGGYLTVRDAAALVGVSLQTMYGLSRTRRIPRAPDGRRLDRAAVEAEIARRRAAPARSGAGRVDARREIGVMVAGRSYQIFVAAAGYGWDAAIYRGGSSLGATSTYERPESAAAAAMRVVYRDAAGED